MITRSSNLATNSVIALVGAPRVTKTLRGLGAKQMTVLRGVEDGKAYQKGLNNRATARDLALLLAAIERGQTASASSTRAMRAILLAQELNDEIPAGLPPGTRVAHKTGQITGVLHDAAIVYPAEHGPYILVVLTSGIPDAKVAQALIVDISRQVYAHASKP
jgi:beta-lactamase class A